ncbi:ecdysteroid-phosphate phosphatase-like [Planococcus citri]|uniref:ecdysteroid-phosphate phosphatase-like n=1 Tax=Planococcus citri TaxID=170843 RepID=UPI0031F910E0
MPVFTGYSMLKKAEVFPTNGQKTNTNIYVMRHAERVDNLFENWISNCSSADGKYVRYDSNMPISLPKREGSIESFRFDSPLTNIGAFESSLIGESLALAGVNIRHAYSSPALRCVQTCHNVFRGAGINDVSIKIEPGLFEWVSLYAGIYPSFMTQEELVNAGFFINKNYQPLYSYDLLKTLLDETSEQYYQRGYDVVNKILKEVSENGGGDILLLGHGSTLDICSRQLIGSKPRDGDVIGRLLYEVPYCGMIKLQQLNNQWKIVDNDVPGISHSSNKGFDYNILHNFY